VGRCKDQRRRQTNGQLKTRREMRLLHFLPNFAELGLAATSYNIQYGLWLLFKKM